MANDEFHNSTGYFRDPGTEQDLTGNEERIVTCKSGEPFTWPMIALSNGDVVKLCSRLWNADEKQCYKEYRNGGTSVKAERKPKESKPKESKPVTAPVEEPTTVVKYSDESAVSVKTLAILAECDECWGVSWINGIAYGMVAKHGSNKVYHIPRACIPDAEWDRICANTGVRR